MPVSTQMTSASGSTTVIQLPEGRLSVTSANHVKHQLIQMLDKNITHIILDLSLLTSVEDSLGIGLLLSTLRTCTQAGLSLKLCGLQSEARLPFELFALSHAFDFYNSVEDALVL